MTGSFDGHANCFVESGDGKALLIDFNYDIEPLPGKYPVPYVGPMSLLEGDPGQPPRQARVPRTSTGTCCCPGVRSRCPPHMSMAGKNRSRREPHHEEA